LRNSGPAGLGQGTLHITLEVAQTTTAHIVTFSNPIFFTRNSLLYSDTLLRDGKILYVQAGPIIGPNFVNRGPAETNKAYNSLLTSIQILLDDIEFGRGDWLYLLRNEDGSDRLIYRRKPLVISNFLWAPLIDEIEIEITRWGIYGTREGWSASGCF
jgi:hypothetical protein